MSLVLASLLAWSAAPTPPRTDLYGDPLPAGAVARMGTVRLRHAGLSDYVCLSHNTALTAGRDRVLRFWDLASGKQTRSVSLAKGNPGTLVTLSPNGKTLAGHRDGNPVLWDVETGKEYLTLPYAASQLGYLYFSPDGATLAAGDPVGKVILYEWKANKRRVLPLPFDRPFSLDSTFHCAFSPDGKWVLAQANSNEPLGVFELATGQLVHQLRCKAYTFLVSPDSKTLVVSSWANDKGGRETVLRFFDLKTGKEVKQYPQGAEPRFFSLAFSPDGKRLACGSSDDSRVLDVATGKVLYRLTERPIAMSYTPDGKRLLASTHYGLRVWDAVTGKELHDRPETIGSTLAAAVNPDGSTLAAADWRDPAVSLWDTSSGHLQRRLPLGGEKKYVRDLSFSPDGKTLTAAQAMGFLQTWDVPSAKEVQSVQLNDPSQPQRESMYYYRLHVARDGRTVSTVERQHSRDGESSRLARWELPRGNLLTDQITLPGEQRSCAWRSDGKSVALFTPDGLTSFDIESGAKRVRAKGAQGGRVQWSVDDRFLSGNNSGEGAVTLWEVATGGEVTTVKTGPIDHFTIAPGNRCLVTADRQALQVWDLATGKMCGRLPLTTDTTVVSALLVTPDGQRAFTALGDGTGLMWDLSFAVRRTAPGRVPAATTLSAWWDDLAATDAARAFAAAWRLADLPPGEALAFLRPRLRPAGNDEARTVAKHMDDLDSDDFATREKASKALESLGPAAVPAMRAAAEKSPSLEAKRRLRALLDKAANAAPPEVLRQVRALLILEGMGKGAGRPLLVELSKGAPHAPMTQAAKEALGRMRP